MIFVLFLDVKWRKRNKKLQEKMRPVVASGCFSSSC